MPNTIGLENGGPDYFPVPSRTRQAIRLHRKKMHSKQRLHLSDISPVSLEDVEPVIEALNASHPRIAKIIRILRLENSTKAECANAINRSKSTVNKSLLFAFKWVSDYLDKESIYT